MSSTFKIATISAAITIATLQLVTHGLPEPEHTAYIDFKGEIADSSGMKRDFMDSLTAAFENPKATGIVVYANSPGGSPFCQMRCIVGFDRLNKNTLNRLHL